jgi:uncharacterized membrane protein
MNFTGIIIGLSTFLIIGILHPVVIKTEYHIGTRAWPVFLITGLACIIGACFTSGAILSPLLSVLGFSLLWSIHELFAQKKRVDKGWYPRRKGVHSVLRIKIANRGEWGGNM